MVPNQFEVQGQQNRFISPLRIKTNDCLQQIDNDECEWIFPLIIIITSLVLCPGWPLFEVRRAPVERLNLGRVLAHLQIAHLRQYGGLFELLFLPAQTHHPSRLGLHRPQLLWLLLWTLRLQILPSSSILTESFSIFHYFAKNGDLLILRTCLVKTV